MKINFGMCGRKFGLQGVRATLDLRTRKATRIGSALRSSRWMVGLWEEVLVARREGIGLLESGFWLEESFGCRARNLKFIRKIDFFFVKFIQIAFFS